MASTQSSQPKGITVSFGNTPQAKDDLFNSNGGIQDSVQFLDVMANDLGGNGKSLYSLGDGTNQDGSPNGSRTSDLLQRDAVGAINFSHLGAKISITANGKVAYDASALGLDHLAAGQHLTDTFTYAIQMGNGAISWATATIDIVGVNDAPVVTGSVKGNATEDGPAVTLDSLANASDVDDGTTLSVVNIPGSLPAGVSYNAATHAFTLDPSNDAYQHLAGNAQQVVTVNYAVSDGALSTLASVSWTVTGVNDQASIGGDAAGNLTEDSATPVTGTLAVSDVDDGEANAATASGNGTNHLGTYTVGADGHWSYTVNNAAVQHLGATATATDTFIVTSLDGTASQQVTITIQGLNDLASISGNASGDATEDGSQIASGALVVSDADDGEAHTKATSGSSSKGSWTVDANGNWSYTLNNAAAQQLGATDTDTDSFIVTSLDGTAQQTVTVNIHGANDDPSLMQAVDSGDVPEDEPQGTSGSPAGLDATLTADGTISFLDMDVSDEHHTVSVTANGLNLLGTMQASVTHDTLHAGATSQDQIGIVSWEFAVSNGDLQFLSQDQELVQHYTITIADDQGGTTTQDVAIHLFGNNDDPTVSADPSTGSIKETDGTPVPGAVLSTDGAFSFADVDTLDSHTVGTPVFVGMTGQTLPVGQLTATLNPDGFSVSWTYTVDAAAVEYLDEGEQPVETFEVPISDNHGGTVNQFVQVTINGSDDLLLV